LHHSSLAISQKHTSLTDQALLIHCSAKEVLTVWHVLSITVLCIRIYRAGWRLSSFKLLCNLFCIIPNLDSTSDTTWAIFSCYTHTRITSSFKYVHFWSFSVMVLWRMWLLGTPTSNKYASLMVLSSITMSGLLLLSSWSLYFTGDYVFLEKHKN
jgi:hypothetical protein